MTRPKLYLLLGAAVLSALFFAASAQAEDAFGQQWGKTYSSQDWTRFYHYPYVYYPENFWGNDYYRSADNMYYRYPPEMQIPVYNKQWHNEFPEPRRYHKGHQFILDVF